MTTDQAHTCYIRHCVRVGGRCVCVLCERYRARVEAEAATPAPPTTLESQNMTPAEASRTNALALMRLGVFRSVLGKFNKESM